MGRTVKVTISGHEWAMPVTFKVSKEIADAVGDPLKLAIDAHQKGTMGLETQDIVAVLHIGCKAAGCSLSRDQIGEAIVQSDEGLIPYVRTAGQYIAAMVSGGPEKPLPTGDAKKNTTPNGEQS